jgi:hypothetical protein
MKIFNFFKRKKVEFSEVKQDRMEECVEKSRLWNWNFLKNHKISGVIDFWKKNFKKRS